MQVKNRASSGYRSYKVSTDLLDLSSWRVQKKRISSPLNASLEGQLTDHLPADERSKDSHSCLAFL